jgi:plastocyanin
LLDERPVIHTPSNDGAAETFRARSGSMEVSSVTVGNPMLLSIHRRLLPVAVAALALAGVVAIPTPTRAAAHDVAITDGAFGPATLTIEVGDTVTWRNRDDRPHTVTDGAGAFDSGNLDPGQGFSFTFREPGTYTYVCRYHDDMVATIVVTDAATAPAAPAAPATPAPAATPAQATAAGGHVTGHGDDQPDTAVLAPAGVSPLVATLLIGLGLVALAFGLVPPRRTPAIAPARAGGRRTGWRR